MKEWGKEKVGSENRVKNVIKGFVSKFGIEEMTLIADRQDVVVFDGKIENFMNPDETMKEYSEEMKNEYVQSVLNHNNKKIFIFI